MIYKYTLNFNWTRCGQAPILGCWPTLLAWMPMPCWTKCFIDFSCILGLLISEYKGVLFNRKRQACKQYFEWQWIWWHRHLRSGQLCPSIYRFSAKKNILPKLEFFIFISIGISRSDLPEILRRRPRILVSSLKNQIAPCYDYLIAKSASYRCSSIVLESWTPVLLLIWIFWEAWRYPCHL